MQTLAALIELAIKEDIGNGDYTTLACIPEGAKDKAQLLVKDKGIIAGVAVARQIFNIIDNSLKVEVFIKDGEKIQPGDVVFNVSGKAQSILSAERLVLNCMQRMSGIATYTNKLVRLIAPYSCKILDTRKTTPNFRLFEKMAVKIGGGFNHREGLYDMMMIKDNHIDFAGGIAQAIHKANAFISEHNMDLKIEIEARNLDEVETILSVGKIDRIMLDNFSFDDLKKAVKCINKKYETEASGGITEQTISDYAACGVDFISVGALTHHINSLDLSLKAIR